MKFFLLMLSWAAWSAEASKLLAPDLRAASYSDDDYVTNSKQISPEIVNDLLEIADLIPKAAIDVVIAEHMVIDSGFRKGFEFLQSSQFIKLVNKLQDEPVIVELLDFLHIWESSANDLDVPNLEIVLLEAVTAEAAQHRQQRRRHRRAVESGNLEANAHLRSFTGAVREILNYLPHDKFKNLISAKCRQSELFSNFYQALRSAQFRPKAKAAMASKDLSAYISTFNAHAIDVKTLMEIAFNVIAWGPDV